jgi:hypothetical protein
VGGRNEEKRREGIGSSRRKQSKRKSRKRAREERIEGIRER